MDYPLAELHDDYQISGYNSQKFHTSPQQPGLTLASATLKQEIEEFR